MLELTGDRGSYCCDGISRRNALKVGFLALGGMGLADLLRLRAEAASPSPKTSVIFVELNGGPTHIETYDPKPNAPAEFRGPLGTVKTNVPGVIFSELMVEQARVMDKLAIIRSVHHDSSSHSAGSHLINTGYYVQGQAGENTMPSVGSITAKARGTAAKGMPAYVSMSGNAGYSGPGYLGKAYSPFQADGDPNRPNFKVPNLTLHRSLDAERLAGRRELLAALDEGRQLVDLDGGAQAWDEFTAEAFDIVTGNRARLAFDIGREPEQVRRRYGRNNIGQSMLLARRLVEAGVTFVTLRVSNWDMHFNIEQGMKRLGPIYDQAAAALVCDLAERGLDRDVLVVAMGEFGRTPRINDRGDGGRDHWGSVMSVMMAGGGYRMGQVIGASTPKGEVPADRPYRPENVLAMVYRHLGIDPAMTFDNLSGRPRHILERREPIVELL